eukprot:2850485-Amphidinium_carterae.1
MIIVLPSTDRRPSGDGEREKESLGDLQPHVRKRQSSGVAERRPDLTNFEVTTKLYPDSESETVLLNEAQCLKGALAQTQGVARALQEKTSHLEEDAKSEFKKASQYKEERSKDLEANFLREMTQRENRSRLSWTKCARPNRRPLEVLAQGSKRSRLKELHIKNTKNT